MTEDIPIQRISMAIRRHSIGPGVAEDSSRSGELLHVAGGSHFQPHLESTQVLKVGVAITDYSTDDVGPAGETGVECTQVYNRAKLTAVKRMLQILQAAVGKASLYGYRMSFDLAQLTIVLILQGVIGIQGQLIKCKTTSLGDGMSPGKVLINAHHRHGYAYQAYAEDIVFPGYGHVRHWPSASCPARRSGYY